MQPWGAANFRLRHTGVRTQVFSFVEEIISNLVALCVVFFQHSYCFGWKGAYTSAQTGRDCSLIKAMSTDKTSVVNVCKLAFPFANGVPGHKQRSFCVKLTNYSHDKKIL